MMVAKLPKLKNPRSDFACSIVKNKSFAGILVAGGFNKNYPMNISEVFDLEKGEWQEIGQLKEAGYGFKMLALDGGIMALGGHDGTRTISSVEKLNLLTGSWEIVGQELIMQQLWYQLTNSVSKLKQHNDQQLHQWKQQKLKQQQQWLQHQQQWLQHQVKEFSNLVCSSSILVIHFCIIFSIISGTNRAKKMFVPCVVLLNAQS